MPVLVELALVVLALVVLVVALLEGSTQTPPLQTRSPLQSVSSMQPLLAPPEPPVPVEVLHAPTIDITTIALTTEDRSEARMVCCSLLAWIMVPLGERRRSLPVCALSAPPDEAMRMPSRNRLAGGPLTARWCCSGR